MRIFPIVAQVYNSNLDAEWRNDNSVFAECKKTDGLQEIAGHFFERAWK
jgi:hypothetical protein